MPVIRPTASPATAASFSAARDAGASLSPALIIKIVTSHCRCGALSLGFAACRNALRLRYERANDFGLFESDDAPGAQTSRVALARPLVAGSSRSQGRQERLSVSHPSACEHPQGWVVPITFLLYRR